MYVLFDLEWIAAEDGTRTMTQLAALRTNGAWQCKDTFCILVKPERGEHDWEQVAYNGYSPDEFWAGAEEEDALRAFFSWLKKSDLLCCWHYQNGKTLAVLYERLFGAKLPFRWAAANQPVYAYFARKGIIGPGGLYQCAQLRGLQTPIPEHCSCNDAKVLRALLAHLQLPPGSIFKKEPKKAKLPPKPELSVREQAEKWIKASPYNYIYLKNSSVFHRRECKLLLNSRDILGSVHYKTAAKGRRPCKVCKPVPLSAEKALNLAVSHDPHQLVLKEAALRHKQKRSANDRVTARLLGGQTVEVCFRTLVGCCHNRIHPGKLTRRMMETHDCLGKECRFFEKYETADYWRECARKADVKQNIRQQRASQKEQAQQQEAALLSLKDQFQTYADDAGYVIKIIRVQEEKRHILKIYYVSENGFRDGDLFPNLLSRIRKEHPTYSILMRHIQDVDEHCVTIEEYERRIK